MLKLAPTEQRIAELEQALAHEKRVAAAERARAAAFEAALKRAYQMVTDARRFDRKGENEG